MKSALDRSARRGVRWTIIGACALLTALMLVYVGEGIVVPARILAFIFGLLLPATSLFSRLGALKELEPAPRQLIGMAIAMIAITPVFYLRRLIPVPIAFDAVLVCILCAASIACGTYRELFISFNDTLFQIAGPVMFGLFPILFGLTWMGWMVHQGSHVTLYGLFPIDFGTALSHVAMIKASPGLPHWHIPGSEIVNYHWLYYTFPAWLSTFGGGHSPDSSCLALCNFAQACLLFAVLCAGCSSLMRMNGLSARPVTVVLAALVVTLASTATFDQIALVYAYRLTHFPLFAVGHRNALLLAVRNSLMMFGNNTLALSIIFLMLYLLLQWNRSRRTTFLVVGAFFLATIPAYSVTLFFPCVLAVGVWLLRAWIVDGNARRFITAVAWMTGIGILGMACLAFGFRMFGSNRGVAIRFDNGLFLRNVFLYMLPLWCLAWMGRNELKKWPLFWLLIGASIVVASLLYIPNSSTGLIDFSMKTGSLIAVAAMPIACSGLEACRRDWRRPMAVVTAAAILIGAASTLGFVGRYAYERASHRTLSSTIALPANYVACLDYIRDHTTNDAVVIDPEPGVYPMAPALDIGERRIFLPDFVTENFIATAYLTSPEITRRRDDFRAWKDSAFKDERIAKEFAAGADYLILPNAEVSGPYWKRIESFGDYTIWQSTIRR